MNKRSLSILALALVAIIAVAGLMAGCGGFPGSSPAKVGDVYIDGAEFTAQVDSYASQYGITQETDPDTYQLLAEDVLDSMINTELAVQKAADLGVEVSGEQVQDRVDELALTYYNGDQDALLEALTGEGMTMEELQKQIENYLLVTAVQDKIMGDAAEPTDEEIAAYYEENMDSFLTDETVEVRHILVGVDGKTVSSSATTTTESTTTTTESTDTSTDDEETTTESTTTTTIAEVAWARALAQAAQIRAELLDGASWDSLAARYSDDLDTKDDGGYLGVVESGDFTDTLGEEFESEALYMDLDQISEPIKTDNGYEIIQVVKINEPQQQSLEEATDAIAATLLSIAQDEAWQTFIDEAKADISVEYAEAYQTTTTEEATEETTETTEETTATDD